MSQQSEERLSESTRAESTAPTQSARIVHLKSRQQNVLQQAIQQRAQETLEREAALDKERRRPKPLKWLVVSLIAAIPAVLTLTAVDGFLKVFHKYLGIAAAQVQKQQEEAAAAEAAAQPIQTEPGVVMLQPMNVPEQASPAEQPAGATQSQAGSAPDPQNQN
jgi:hypothetical protein